MAMKAILLHKTSADIGGVGLLHRVAGERSLEMPSHPSQATFQLVL